MRPPGNGWTKPKSLNGGPPSLRKMRARVAVCFRGAASGKVVTGRRSSSDRFPREFLRTRSPPLSRVCRRHRTSTRWRNRKRRARRRLPDHDPQTRRDRPAHLFRSRRPPWRRRRPRWSASSRMPRAAGSPASASASGRPRPASRATWSPTARAASTPTALSAGEYELRASLDGFRPLVQTGLRLTVGESAAVTLTLQVGTAEEVTVRGTSAVNTQTGELSYLTDQRTIEQIPVNGRNYTDLMQLLPTVNAFPHRDNGSVVAHGLAMSVNGQNPRTNVYLLDGTLQNDFTNSPASSAAGTALGMETIREFRARLEQLQRRVRPRRRRPDQRHHQVRHQPARRQRASCSTATTRSTPATTSTSTRSRPSAATSSAARWAARCDADRLFFFVGYEGLFENLGRTIVTTVPDDNARRGVLPTGTGRRSARTSCPTCSSSRVANGPSLGGGLAQHRFGFDQRLAAELRPGPRRRRAVRRLAVLRPLHARRRRAGPADRLSAVPARLRLDATSS